MASDFYPSSRVFFRYPLLDFQNNHGSYFSWGLFADRQMDLSFEIAQVSIPFPPPSEFIKSSRDLSFPQIIAFATALSGIFLAVFLVKAFSK